MNYLFYQLRRALQSMVITILLIAVLWSLLYHLTDARTVSNYFWCGLAVCSANTIIANIRTRKIDLIRVCGSWVVMAGVVLVLYHGGFVAAAVLAAGAFFASPFFGATLYEGFVGLTLLIQLCLLIP